MRLEKASAKAIKYACMNFHYAKSIPVNTFGYSVFNQINEWCGVVLFGSGANNNLPKMFGLNSGEVIELVRMALNGKQGVTGSIMAVALKLARKHVPLAKIIVSYADSNQGHIGTIYQATNWIYTGSCKLDALEIDGIQIHRKSVYSKYGYNSVERLNRNGVNAKWIKGEVKHRYIYPLDKSLIPMCKALSKPYPKKQAVEA